MDDAVHMDDIRPALRERREQEKYCEANKLKMTQALPSIHPLCPSLHLFCVCVDILFFASTIHSTHPAPCHTPTPTTTTTTTITSITITSTSPVSDMLANILDLKMGVQEWSVPWACWC